MINVAWYNRLVRELLRTCYEGVWSHASLNMTFLSSCFTRAGQVSIIMHVKKPSYNPLPNILCKQRWLSAVDRASNFLWHAARRLSWRIFVSDRRELSGARGSLGSRQPY